jgi:hypothetical protein
MWQRNECGLRKQPSAAVSYSSAGPALGTSGRRENRLQAAILSQLGVRSLDGPTAASEATALLALQMFDTKSVGAWRAADNCSA